jgi:hypothetical protein
MSVWHEPISPEINHSFASKDECIRAIIRRRDHFGGVNTIHFLLRQGDGTPLLPKREPDKWCVLTPRVEISEVQLPAAKERAHEIMNQIVLGERDDDFHITPYVLPPRMERLTEIDHIQGKLKAIIGKKPDGKHEVRYFVHELLGVWSNSQTEEWDWVRTRWELATFADDLPSAEEIARIEIEELALGKKHPGIRQWFGGVGENSSSNQSDAPTTEVRKTET